VRGPHHACLALDGNGYLYAGDCPAHLPYEGIKGVALTLNYDTVTMALQATCWAKVWGMLVDRFGTPWIVNGERIPF